MTQPETSEPSGDIDPHSGRIERPRTWPDVAVEAIQAIRGIAYRLIDRGHTSEFLAFIALLLFAIILVRAPNAALAQLLVHPGFLAMLAILSISINIGFVVIVRAHRRVGRQDRERYEALLQTVRPDLFPPRPARRQLS